MSILSVHSTDEAAIAIHVLRVQEAEVASEHIVVALGSDETKAETAPRFRQFEEIARIELSESLREIAIAKELLMAAIEGLLLAAVNGTDSEAFKT